MVGRAFVVHEGVDDLGKGEQAKRIPNAGSDLFSGLNIFVCFWWWQGAMS